MLHRKVALLMRVLRLEPQREILVP